MKTYGSLILGIPLVFSLIGCMESTQGPSESSASKPLVVPWKQEVHEHMPVAILQSSQNEHSRPSAKGTATATVRTQNMNWYKMENAQSYDVAVGWYSDIFHINNNRDIYRWIWKNGSWQQGDPAGGKWEKLPGLAGIKWARLASSESDILVALSTAWNAYVFNGTTWIQLANGMANGSATDIAVSPDGTVFATATSPAHPNARGVMKWNNSLNKWETLFPTNSASYVFNRVGTYGGLYQTPGPIVQDWVNYMMFLSGGSLHYFPDISKSYDIGGHDGTGLIVPGTNNDYRLWVINNDDGLVYYNDKITNCDLSGNNCVSNMLWWKTNGNGSNLAASYRNYSVVRQSPARYVYFSTDAAY